MNLFTMENITKSYTDRILLDDVGFSINENEKMCIRDRITSAMNKILEGLEALGIELRK